MKLESEIQSQIKIKLEKHGWNVKKLFNIPGFPDLLCLKKPGICMFIEVKRPGEEPEPLQEFIHKQLRRMEFKVFVISDVKQINDEIINCS